MTCSIAPEPFLPEGKHKWSENVCLAGVFGWATDDEGYQVPVSINLMRAMKDPNVDEETGEQTHCRYHVGNLSMDDYGYQLPWYCGNPVSELYYVSPMATSVDDEGYTVNVGYHKVIWTELVYYSLDRYCSPAML